MSQHISLHPEDRLVEKVPVYLSQEFANTLHIVKSPLRAPSRPYADIGPLAQATYQPIHQILEFQHTLDPTDAHYNHHADNQIDTVVLQSTPMIKRSNYVMCQRTENALILHPVAGIHSLLPAFNHVDDLQQQYDNDLAPQQDGDDDQAYRQVQLKVKRSEKVGGVKKVTHDSLQQALREDKPVVCEYILTDAAAIMRGEAPAPKKTAGSGGEGAMRDEDEYDDDKMLVKKEKGNKMNQSSAPTSSLDDIDAEATKSEYKAKFDLRMQKLLTSKPTYDAQQLQQNQAQPHANTNTNRPQHYINPTIVTPFPDNNVVDESETFRNNSSALSQPQPTTTTTVSSAATTTTTTTTTTPAVPTLSREKVIAYMLFSRLTSFKNVCTNLAISTSALGKDLVRELARTCFIVHGNVVIHSKFVYPANIGQNSHAANAGSKRGSPAHHLQVNIQRLYNARNYILSCFAQQQPPAAAIAGKQVWKPRVKQSEITAVVKGVDNHELNTILQEFATKLDPYADVLDDVTGKKAMYPKEDPALVKDTVWEFRLPYDAQFVKTFPNLVQNSATELDAVIQIWQKP